MDFKRQLEDYTAALRTYIAEATGESSTRIIFATPDLAKRVLKEKLNDTAEATTLNRTIEIDNFISFYFDYSHSLPSDRDSVIQNFYGAKAMGSRKGGWVSNMDIPIKVDIWGGPGQKGGLYVFDTGLKFKNYWKRNRTLQVQFRDLINKDTSTPILAPFDVNTNYNFELESIMDSSLPEGRYEIGANHRTTAEMILCATFYDMEGPPIGKFEHIQVEYDATHGDATRIEVAVPAS